MLVFQFGAGMSTCWLNAPNRLGGVAQVVGPAWTCDLFDLEFSAFSRANGCGIANLTGGRGRSIFGVLYDVPDERVGADVSGVGPSLDEVEEVGTVFDRVRMRVFRPEDPDTIVNAFGCQARQPEVSLRTELAYVVHLSAGLVEHRAPREFSDYVKLRVICSNPRLSGALDAFFGSPRTPGGNLNRSGF